ncbi:MAG: LamG-like jellyroll fold domain-containing protein [Planctomycetota bacterium]
MNTHLRPIRTQPAPAVRARGLAMVLVMIALAVGTIIALTFLSSQTTSTAIAHNATRQVQARAVAEDGMRLVIEHLRTDTEWRDGYTHGTWATLTGFNGGTARVLFEDEEDSDLGDDVSDPFVLTVEGTFSGVVHRISNRVVPTGTSSTITVMFVSGNAYHADEDLERIAVIESWGYNVFTVADSDPQSAYDAAAALSDVIYVSEESASGSVGTKLNGYPIGVVNEEQALQDELKMSTSGGNWTGSTIDITDNTHPITSGFALGELQITHNSTGMIQSGGTPAAGLNTLAERVSSSTRLLTYLEIGDTMTDGNPSPQRRVTLPFGSNAFEYDQLNDDGQRLMKQAIDWAAQSPGDTLSADHRWTLNETSGVAAQDDQGGLDGTYTLGPTLGTIGVSGTAATFSESTFDRVTLPVEVLDGLTDYTVSLWLKTTKTGQQAVFSGASGSNNNSQLLFFNNSSQLRYYYGSGTGTYKSWGMSSVADDQWHHVVLVRDQTLSEVTLYLNGVSLGTQSQSMSAVDIEHLVLAEEQDSVDGGYVDSQSFEGSMDDVRIFASILSADQVLDLYEQAATNGDAPALVALYEFEEPSPVTPQLVGHWKLNESSAASTFVEVGGEVVMEAENYTSLTPGTGIGSGSTWNTTTTNSPSGGTALIAEPNSGANMGGGPNGPRLDYEITFNTPGTYRVWVRMIGPSGSDDSVHVGLDGVCISKGGGYGLSYGSRSAWAWEDDVASGASNISFDIPSAGTYTFNVWMREDGTLIDKIVLNTSASEPSGSGPVESERGGTAVDEIGVGNGSFVSSVNAGVAGFGDGGTSIEFNGSDAFVEVPHNSAYLLDRGTLSFWFRANDLSGTQGLIAKDATSYQDGGHFRVITNGSRLEVRLQSDSSSHYVQSANGSLSASTWHHVAVGFGSGGLQLYLDGALVDSDSYAGGLGPSSGGTGNAEPWTFGVDQWTSSSGSTSGWGYPYHGRLDDIRLYDQNLDADQVADLFANTDPRAAIPAVVNDTSGNSPALDLSIADPGQVTWISGGGLTIDSATSIASKGPVTRLHTAITESDEITVEAVFTPANITQDGPARILTYSNGTSNRNFHLGQTDDAYDVRLRTEFKTSGTPEAASGPVLVADTREHVIFTYDNTNEELRVYRNGTLEITETWTGDLDNWDSGYELLMVNEASGNRDWLGTLHRVAIYDGAFNGIQADNVFNGDAPGDGTGGDEGLAYEVEWLESP